MRFVFIILIGLFFSACYTKNVKDFSPTTTVVIPDSAITYSGSVKSIISTNCSFSNGCHGSASSVLNLDDYNSLKSAATSVKKSINHESGASPMPKGGTKLSSSDISTIEKWIQNNFPN